MTTRLDTARVAPPIVALARTLARMTLAAVPPEHGLHARATDLVDALGQTSEARVASRAAWELRLGAWGAGDDVPAIVLCLRRCLDACFQATVDARPHEGVKASLRTAAAQARDALLWAAYQSQNVEEVSLAGAYACCDGANHPSADYGRALADVHARHGARVAAVFAMVERACATVPGVWGD